MRRTIPLAVLAALALLLAGCSGAPEPATTSTTAS